MHPVRGRIGFEPYAYQADFLTDHAQRRIVLKARQVGYSQVFAIESLYTAVHRPESTILLISRSQDLAANLLRYCYAAYNGLKHAPALVKENAGEMELDNGSRIKSLPANRNTARGFSATYVYLDEFAYAAYSDDIYQSISPTLSQGGHLTIASTPNGLGNTFNRLWVSGDFSRHKINWRECPAYYTPEERAAGVPPEECAWYKLNRPNYTDAAWAAEYDCDFSTSGGQVFRNVKPLSTLAPSIHAGHRVVFGVDFAQARDYTVISAICADCHEQLEIDRFNRVEWEMVRGRISVMRRRHNAGLIVAERNSAGGPNIEAMQNEGMPIAAFDTTAATKSPLIQSLALALERGELKLLDDETQVNELESYAMTPSALTGRPTYSAPNGMHDDTVMALALAWHGLEQLPVKAGVLKNINTTRPSQFVRDPKLTGSRWKR